MSRNNNRTMEVARWIWARVLVFITATVTGVASVWGTVEAYTYFCGDALKNYLGVYWWIPFYGLPLLFGVLACLFYSLRDDAINKERGLIKKYQDAAHLNVNVSQLFRGFENTVPKNFQGAFLLDLCLWLASKAIDYSFVYSLQRFDTLLSTSFGRFEDYSKDSLVKSIESSFPRKTMNNCIPSELSNWHGTIGSFQTLLSLYISELRFYTHQISEAKGKQTENIRYQTIRKMLRLAIYDYQKLLDDSVDLNDFNNFIKSVRHGNLRYQLLEFESSNAFWEYINPSINSLNTKTDEMRLLLYKKVLKKGVCRQSELLADGFDLSLITEISNVLINAKWAEFDFDTNQLKMTKLGKKLLTKKLQSLNALT